MVTFKRSAWMLIAGVAAALFGPIGWAGMQANPEPGISRGSPMSRHRISGCPLGADYYARFVSLRNKGLPEDSYMQPGGKQSNSEFGRAQRQIAHEIWTNREWSEGDVRERYISRCHEIERKRANPPPEVMSLMD